MRAVSQAVAAPSTGVKSKSAAMLGLKLLLTALAFGFLLARQSVSELWRAAREMSVWALAAGVLIQLVCLGVGTVRWRGLLRAYGAEASLPLASLFRIYLVAVFYNTYLPGAVGGDLMRGVLTRKAFGTAGTTRAVSVVLVERALGLAGLMILTTLSLAFASDGDLAARVRPFSILAAVCIVAGALAFGHSHVLARYAPGRMADFLRTLPELQNVWLFAAGLVLSVLTHALFAVCGHVLIHAMLSSVTLAQSFWAVPLAGAAGYFPLTVAGAGARDYVMVQLYVSSGVPSATATVTALAVLLTTLITGAIGGLIQWFAPLDPASKQE